MKKIILDDIQYELYKEYKNGFDEEELKNKYTDYFYDYDYIVGDWAYGKLRLKGFCNKENKKLNKVNDFENVDNYIKKECAYECRYFIIKKVSNEK